MSVPVLVGLLDSGVGPDLHAHLAGARAFGLDAGGEPVDRPPAADALGHGSALARIILRLAPSARIVNAQVFARAAAASPAAIAAGLSWLESRGVAMVNMSFGLTQDRRVLREACAAARAAGIVLVAAAPARGAPVYPSAYRGVLRVTGDARCAPGEFSHLATAQADFGACPRGPDHRDGVMPAGGASFAVAYVTGVLAAYLGAGGERREVARYLAGIADYHGPERKGTNAARE